MVLLDGDMRLEIALGLTAQNGKDPLPMRYLMLVCRLWKNILKDNKGSQTSFGETASVNGIDAWQFVLYLVRSWSGSTMETESCIHGNGLDTIPST